MNVLKKKIVLLFTVLACALCMLPKMNTQAQDLIVVLDPGHGGIEGGAARTLRGKTYREEIINMKIANYCKAELETYEGVKVYLTRSSVNQRSQDRETRVNIAKRKHADVLVSLHINATGSYSQTSTTGAYVCVPSSRKWPSSKSTTAQEARDLANVILKELRSQTGLKNNGFWIDDELGILVFGQKNNYSTSQARKWRMTKSEINTRIPSMIVEHCFVNNPNDCRKHLKTDAQIQKMGVADATGIAKFYGLQKKGSSSIINTDDETENSDETENKNETENNVKKGIVEEKGALYLYDNDGTVMRGLVKYQKHYYYAGPDGKLKTGWKKINDRKYYFDNKTGAARTGLQTIGKNKYFFSSKGVMKTKWVTIEGKKYYFSKVNGKLLTHYWLKYNNKWYRLDRNGTPLVDCERKVGKNWYTFNKKGVCINK